MIDLHTAAPQAHEKKRIFYWCTSYARTCPHIVKIIRGVQGAAPGRAEPSRKYHYTAATAASLREHSSTAATNKKILWCWNSHAIYCRRSIRQKTAAAAKQQQSKAEVENLSKIHTLNNDRAEPRHSEKSTHTGAAAVVYPAGRPQQQHRQEAR